MAEKLEVELNVRFHDDPRLVGVLEKISDRLDVIFAITRNTHRKVTNIMADLTALTAAVARFEDVEASAITLIKGLKTALDAAGTDPVALKALSDKLGTDAEALAAAVAENTPAAP
jgi:hypothetical protein